ncbi:ABC transporter permease [Pasteurellaceae bacterium RH1A]|nr:ABC transporter permease [Pasteurellaceae bacterium RH1A]
MLLAILTILAYLSALLWIMPTIVKVDYSGKPNVKAVFLIGLVAVLLHFFNLSQQVWQGEGQNITVTNIVSLMSLMMSTFATFALPKWRTIWHPLSVLYVLGIVSVALSSFVSGNFIKHLEEDSGLLFHLAIAVFSYGLFFIALLYAFQLKWLDKKLKSKNMVFCTLFPPLMTVERHFFALTLSGQVLLSIALITGMIYLHNFFAPEQVHKAVFSFMAWIVYAIQLLGQWKLHWRGKRVLIYSISGMILLTIGYFGSRVV